jgi:hypothetical protein
VEVFRIDPETAEALVASIPAVVRTGVSEAVARKYFNAFMFMGAECEFRASAPLEPEAMSLPPVRADTDAASVSTSEVLRAQKLEAGPDRDGGTSSSGKADSAVVFEVLASTPPTAVGIGRDGEGEDAHFDMDERLPMESESLPLVLPEGVEDWDHWLDMDDRERVSHTRSETGERTSTGDVSTAASGGETRIEAPQNEALIEELERRANTGSRRPFSTTEDGPQHTDDAHVRRDTTPVPDRSREDG